MNTVKIHRPWYLLMAITLLGALGIVFALGATPGVASAATTPATITASPNPLAITDGMEAVVTVMVENDAEGSETITADSDDDEIATVEAQQTLKEGTAKFTVTAQAPGDCSITFKFPGNETLSENSCTIDVTVFSDGTVAPSGAVFTARDTTGGSFYPENATFNLYYGKVYTNAQVTVQSGADLISMNYPAQSSSFTVTPVVGQTSGVATILVTFTGSNVDPLTQTITITLQPVTAILTEQGYIDVPLDAWYTGDVAEAIDHGIIIGWSNGFGQMLFGPEDLLTRGQAATILWRYAEPEQAAAYIAADAVNDTPWKDVADGQFYTGAMNWAYDNGVFNGYDGTSNVGPNNTITREQLCAILYNLATTKYNVPTTGANPSSYEGATNQASVSTWAQNVVGWAYYNQIMTGYEPNHNLAAQDNVTRAQSAKMFVYTFGRVIQSW